VQPSTHADSRVACDAETYLRRGWCRLEQWAFMSVHGIGQMWMSGASPPAKRLRWRQAAKVSSITTAWMGARAPPVRVLPRKPAAPPPTAALTKLGAKPGWLSQSIRVMDGDFTVPEDKEQLVDVVLGLYAFTAVTGEDEGGLQHLIDDMKEVVFPAAHFGNLVGRLEAELECSRKDFSSTFTSLRALATSTSKQGRSVFQSSDFEAMLTAKEAYLRVQGKGLNAELKTKLEQRGSHLALPVSGIAIQDQEEEISGMEHKALAPAYAASVSPAAEV